MRFTATSAVEGSGPRAAHDELLLAFGRRRAAAHVRAQVSASICCRSLPPLTLAPALLAFAIACGDHVTSPRIPADALSLRLGETRAVALDAAAHVASGDAATEYTVVAFASTSGSVVNLQVMADGIENVVGPPTPILIPASQNASAHLTAGHRTSDFTLRLHAAEEELLATRGSAARAAYRALQADPVRAMAVPAINDEMTINASIDACGPPTLRTGRVVYVSDYLVFVEDEGNPSGGLTAADYQSLAAEYETVILPVLTDNFGASTDIDDNGGRTTVFFSRTVNELSNAASSSVIRSFFYVRDLLPKSTCAGSNEAELIYIAAPDETGSINGRPWPTADVRAFVAMALARGGTFMRDEGRRLYVTQAPRELSWLADAMACIAEELVFYRAATLSPRRNLSADNLVSGDVVRAAFNKYQIANFFRLGDYLAKPEPSSPASGGTGASGPA